MYKLCYMVSALVTVNYRDYILSVQQSCKNRSIYHPQSSSYTTQHIRVCSIITTLSIGFSDNTCMLISTVSMC